MQSRERKHIKLELREEYEYIVDQQYTKIYDLTLHVMKLGSCSFTFVISLLRLESTYLFRLSSTFTVQSPRVQK